VNLRPGFQDSAGESNSQPFKLAEPPNWRLLDYEKDLASGARFSEWLS
jgi:hypothetical protein